MQNNNAHLTKQIEFIQPSLQENTYHLIKNHRENDAKTTMSNNNVQIASNNILKLC